jgi:phosphoinositide-3-kinase regulatory subunit 4
MIVAVHTVHEKFNLYHGNIRTSNFLLTNYSYLMLADFANYKPNYILQDTEQGLAEFRLFYSSSIDKCNLAP